MLETRRFATITELAAIQRRLLRSRAPRDSSKFARIAIHSGGIAVRAEIAQSIRHGEQCGTPRHAGPPYPAHRAEPPEPGRPVTSLKNRRKKAGWNQNYLENIIRCTA